MTAKERGSLHTYLSTSMRDTSTMESHSEVGGNACSALRTPYSVHSLSLRYHSLPTRFTPEGHPEGTRRVYSPSIRGYPRVSEGAERGRGSWECGNMYPDKHGRVHTDTGTDTGTGCSDCCPVTVSSLNYNKHAVSLWTYGHTCAVVG